MLMLHDVVAFSLLCAWGPSCASSATFEEPACRSGFDSSSALQTNTGRGSRTAPEPTPAPTPEPTPVPCKKNLQYCSELCEAFDCEDERLQCERYCRWRWSMFKNIMDQYDREGVCARSLAQTGVQQKVDDSSAAAAAGECKQPSYYCVRICSTFSSLDWLKGVDCQDRCESKWGKFKTSWDFYKAHGICSWYDEEDEGDAEVNVARGGMDDSSALQARRAQVSRTAPEPTLAPTPEPTPVPCKKNLQYCSELCEAFDCEDERLQCERYCRWRWSMFKNIMDQYDREGVCARSLAQQGVQQKVDDSSAAAAAGGCKQPSYYCVRICSTFSSLDWLKGVDCQDRCESKWGKFKTSWDFYKAHGICSWYDEEDEGDAEVNVARGGMDDSSALQAGRAQVSRTAPEPTPAPTPEPTPVPCKKNLQYCSELCEAFDCEDERLQCERYCRWRWSMFKNIMDQYDREGVCARSLAQTGVQQKVDDSSAAAAAGECKQPSYYCVRICSTFSSLDWLKGVDCQDRCESKWGKFKTSWDFYKAHGICSWYDEEDEGDAEVNVARGGMDDSSALQAGRAQVSRTAPEPTPAPTPEPTPVPCKKNLQYCSELCEAFDCEDERLQCERYCRWRWSMFKNIMDQYDREGVCARSLAQTGVQQKVEDSSAAAAAGECKQPSYYCVRICSTFSSLDWLKGVDCQDRCESKWGKFKTSWDFYKAHGICSWYDEEDEGDVDDSSALQAGRAQVSRTAPEPTPAPTPELTPVPCKKNLQYCSELCEAFDCEDERLPCERYCRWPWSMFKNIMDQYDGEGVCARSLAQTGVQQKVDDSSAAAAAGECKQPSYYCVRICSTFSSLDWLKGVDCQERCVSMWGKFKTSWDFYKAHGICSWYDEEDEGDAEVNVARGGMDDSSALQARRAQVSRTAPEPTLAPTPEPTPVPCKKNLQYCSELCEAFDCEDERLQCERYCRWRWSMFKNIMDQYDREGVCARSLAQQGVQQKVDDSSAAAAAGGCKQPSYYCVRICSTFSSLDWLKGVDCQERCESKWGKFKTSWDFYKAHGICSWYDEEDEGDAEVNVARGGMDDSSALQAGRAQVSRTAPEPTPTPTPEPTPVPCKKNLQYCSELCEAFDCEDERLQCERYCRWRWSMFKNIMDQYDREGVCARSLAQTGVQQKVDGSSAAAAAGECKQPSYYCVRICSTFSSLDWLKGVDCQERCESKWGKFKTSWDFYKAHGICSWYDEEDEGDAEVNVARGGMDDSSALQAGRAQVSRTAPEPTPAPTPEPTPVPCKKNLQYCSELCEAFDCEDERLQCERYCRWRWSMFKNIMDQYDREGVCARSLAQTGVQQKVDDSSAAVAAGECKQPSYYCVRICSTFSSLDWLKGVDCQDRCESKWGKFKTSWDFYKAHGICSWYDEEDEGDAEVNVARGGMDDSSALQAGRAQVSRTAPEPTPAPTPEPTPVPCKKNLQYCSELCEAFDCEDERLQCERYCRWRWPMFKNIMDQYDREGVCARSLAQTGVQQKVEDSSAAAAAGECKQPSYYCVRICSTFSSLDWLKGVDCQDRCESKWGKFKTSWDFYKAHGICSWYDEEDEGDAEVNVAHGGMDDSSALQAGRAQVSRTAPEPTPAPTPEPTPVPCKKNLQYCSELCEAFDCEDERLQCERYCRWRWSMFKNIMDQYDREGVCARSLAQTGAQQKVEDLSAAAAAGECKQPSYYCVRICSTFSSLDWLKGVDCQDRCESKWGKFKTSWDFYKAHGICSWYDEEDEGDAEVNVARGGMDDSSA